MKSIEQTLNSWMLIELFVFLIGFSISLFCVWLLYIYVTSKRDWLEEDIRIREAERVLSLARAEQIKVETASLKHTLNEKGVRLGDSISVI